MLFNLKDDIGEKSNLAGTQPFKLKELQAAFAEWEQGTQPAKWVRQDSRNAQPGGTPNEQANPATRLGVGRMARALQPADKNNDGKLSAEEFPQPDIFKDIDKDGDGFATREEIRDYTKKGK